MIVTRLTVPQRVYLFNFTNQQKGLHDIMRKVIKVQDAVCVDELEGLPLDLKTTETTEINFGDLELDWVLSKLRDATEHPAVWARVVVSLIDELEKAKSDSKKNS